MRLFKMLLLSFITCFFCIVESPATERKLLIVAESFPPFEFVASGQIVGKDIDVISDIFKKMNIDFEIWILPWNRAWRMIKQGEADAVLSTSRKEKVLRCSRKQRSTRSLYARLHRRPLIGIQR